MTSPVDVFNIGSCKRRHFLTPITKVGRTRALPASRRGKEGQSRAKGKPEARTGLFLAPVGLAFQTCAAPTYCQWFLGTANS